MARRRNYKRNYNNARGLDGWGVFGAFVAFLLVAVLLFLMIATTFFTNWKGETWFNYWGKGPGVEQVEPGDDEQPADEQPAETPGDNSVIENTQNEVMSLMSTRLAGASAEEYAVPEGAIDAFLVEATVYDQEERVPAPLQHVEFTAAWDSEFIRPSEATSVYDPNLQNTISLIKQDETSTLVVVNTAFNVRILITATSTLDSSVKVTTTLDYVRPVTDIACRWVPESVAHTPAHFSPDEMAAGTAVAYYNLSLPGTTRSYIYEGVGGDVKTGTIDNYATAISDCKIKYGSNFTNDLMRAGILPSTPSANRMVYDLMPLQNLNEPVKSQISVPVNSNIIYWIFGTPSYTEAQYNTFLDIVAEQNVDNMQGGTFKNRGHLIVSYTLTMKYGDPINVSYGVIFTTPSSPTSITLDTDGLVVG